LRVKPVAFTMHPPFLHSELIPLILQTLVDASLAGRGNVAHSTQQSPIANTVMVTLANGMANSGYIPDDASFGAYTFQVLSSRLKPGCAETAIDGGLMNLLVANDK
jgi:hypothetical protein